MEGKGVCLIYLKVVGFQLVMRQHSRWGASVGGAGVIGSDVPWLECPACNALTWVITVTE